MSGHPMGYTAGAKAFRQAIDAAMAGIPLDVASKNLPESRRRTETWGIASAHRPGGVSTGRSSIRNSPNKNI